MLEEALRQHSFGTCWCLLERINIHKRLIINELSYMQILHVPAMRFKENSLIYSLLILRLFSLIYGLQILAYVHLKTQCYK